jgi:exonuclease 3'-5' domain-containing protein 2
MANTKTNILVLGSRSLNHENWKVYNVEGRHMFTCGEKKASWYLERGLAVVRGVGEITFTFTPNGYGYEDNEDFGRSVREIRCVVNGEITGLQRHHIVPYCYRAYFPVEFKSKNHHDVALINFKLHSDYEREAEKFKLELSEIYGVETVAELNNQYSNKLREIGKEYSMILSALTTVLKGHDRLSDEIILGKLKYVSENANIPYEDMIRFTYIELMAIYVEVKRLFSEKIDTYQRENRKFYDHGYHLVQKLTSDEMIEDFIKLWRRHFIKTMKPKYMPDGWSVDFRCKTKI